jgi:hypothetical protein
MTDRRLTHDAVHCRTYRPAFERSLLLPSFITLMTTAVNISETSVSIYQTTRSNIPDYRHLQIMCCMFHVPAVQLCAYSQRRINSAVDNASLNKPDINHPSRVYPAHSLLHCLPPSRPLEHQWRDTWYICFRCLSKRRLPWRWRQ